MFSNPHLHASVCGVKGSIYKKCLGLNEMFGYAQKNDVCQLPSVMGERKSTKICFLKWDEIFSSTHKICLPHTTHYGGGVINVYCFSSVRNWVKYPHLDRKVMFTKPLPHLGKKGMGLDFQKYHVLITFVCWNKVDKAIYNRQTFIASILRLLHLMKWPQYGGCESLSVINCFIYFVSTYRIY